jgi:outer membrane protein assembly factor BamE (lipoprotein component of BamABCDE complex)
VQPIGAAHYIQEGIMKLAAGILAGVLAVLLGLSGCATSGSSSGGGPATGQFLILNDQLVAQIKDGVSTKDDVKGLLGNPGGISTRKEVPDLPADMETWAYVATTQTHAYALVVIFKNGIVLSHNKNVQPIK